MQIHQELSVLVQDVEDQLLVVERVHVGNLLEMQQPLEVLTIEVENVQDLGERDVRLQDAGQKLLDVHVVVGHVDQVDLLVGLVPVAPVVPVARE